MRVALANPPWSFENSTYFGCREPHLPLELGYAKALLERAGHEARIFDAHLVPASIEEQADQIGAYAPEMTVVATAPTYLFWRCTQPELRIPRELLLALGERGGITVAVGPHGSATPGPTLKKLGCDIVVRGECEEIIAALAERPALESVPAIAFERGGEAVITGPPHAGRFTDLPALDWPADWLGRHHHHHHRYGTESIGPGAEVEASRGCPYHCSFCAKIDFRDAYRKRELGLVLQEIDGLIAKGVRYIYFVDEIFLPDRPLLEALQARAIEFGVQTRIDLWKPSMLDLLGAAGCVSIEAGVESLTFEGRAALDKMCRASTDELADRLIHARRSVPFVQANLIEASGDDAALVAAWRDKLLAAGVWANDPVPLYPYPSTPDYRKLWGEPDDLAWERAHAHYLAQFDRFSDIQAERPAPLAELEAVLRVSGRSHVLMTADAVGGVWTYALDLGRGLVGAGVRVTLAVLGPAPDEAQFNQALAAGLEVVALDGALDWTAADEGEVAAAAGRLGQLAARLRPDLVHLNSPALAAFGTLGAPVLAACHSCVRTWWRAVHGDAPIPDDLAWRAALVEKGYAKAAALLAPSRAFADATAAAYAPRQSPHVVHNGRAVFPCADRAGEDRWDAVFTAGRLWDEAKDVLTLDRALAALDLPAAAAGPLSGPGGQTVALHRLDPLGRLAEAQLQARLAGRPVFVSSSRYEPFGLAVLEAAQHGCPLVLSDLATFRELWDGAALFFPPGDDIALAALLTGLAADPDRRIALGCAAQSRAARYTLDAMTNATLALYARLSPAFARAEAAA